ncbi:MAG TPA: deoxyribonuclease IV, partial [Candidatus Goldiibacteriota bacterium]|nr:deoxyribonuclease IV [Candidatus Goldiibacteriota bacterium]
VSKKAEAIQIFTANQRMWKVKDIPDEDVKLFFEKKEKSGLKAIVSHDSYLINLASGDKQILEKSRKAFKDEIRRSMILKLDAVIFHPGSFSGTTYENGIKNIIDSLNILMPDIPEDGPFLLLETTAGSGNTIGGKFEELAEVIKGVKMKDKIGICFDTAHAFEAGYDVKNNYDGVFNEFDKMIGIEKLRAMHINDSKTAYASRADRHEHIGKGEIGKITFNKLMKDKKFEKIPMIIETPKIGNWDVINMKLLNKMRGSREKNVR